MKKADRRALSRRLGRGITKEDVAIAQSFIDMGVPLECLTDFEIQDRRVEIRGLMAQLR